RVGCARSAQQSSFDLLPGREVAGRNGAEAPGGGLPIRTGAKTPFNLPSMLPRLSSTFSHFFPSLTSFLEELGHIVLISLHTCLLVLRRTGGRVPLSCG